MAAEAQQPNQVQEDEEDLDEFDHIDKLQQFGINAGDLKKCKEGGFHTCQSLLMYPKKVLCEIRGLSEAKIDKCLDAARKVVLNNGWQSATQYASKMAKEVLHITTGCAAVDEILQGGIETKAITEIYGEYRTGKTQICYTLCVTCQMGPESGGGAGKVAVIDTEGTFRPKRIIPIAERFGLDGEAVIDNVLYARAYTFEQQSDLLQQVAAKMVEEPFKMLIVDSVTANMRIDYSGRGELAERQQKLGQLMAKLRKIAEEFNVAVVITNQVMSDPSGGAMFVVDPKKPVGGHVMAHASTFRLSLRKGKGEQRLVKIVQAPTLAEAEASYQIGPNGIMDFAGENGTLEEPNGLKEGYGLEPPGPAP